MGVTSAPFIVTEGVFSTVKVPEGVTIPLGTAGVTDPKPNATMATWELAVATTMAVFARDTLKICVPAWA
jgi:hypothetical protein